MNKLEKQIWEDIKMLIETETNISSLFDDIKEDPTSYDYNEDDLNSFLLKYFSK